MSITGITKTSFVCPCCSGPILFESDNEDKYGRYVCNCCEIGLPIDSLNFAPTAKMGYPPKYMCAKHGGCQGCHHTIATVNVTFWLSEAMKLEQEEAETANVCQACFGNLTKNCVVEGSRPIQKAEKLYDYLMTKRIEAEKARQKKTLAALRPRNGRTSLTKSGIVGEGASNGTHGNAAPRIETTGRIMARGRQTVRAIHSKGRTYFYLFSDTTMNGIRVQRTLGRIPTEEEATKLGWKKPGTPETPSERIETVKVLGPALDHWFEGSDKEAVPPQSEDVTVKDATAGLFTAQPKTKPPRLQQHSTHEETDPC